MILFLLGLIIGCCIGYVVGIFGIIGPWKF